jgi:hypothetical protein
LFFPVFRIRIHLIRTGSGFRIRIWTHWPVWIRIQYGSGYEPLVLFFTTTVTIFSPKRKEGAPLLAVLRIRISLMLIGSRINPACHFDADPDPACHWCGSGSESYIYFDADPDPSFQIKAQSLQSAQIGSYSIHFGLSSANRCRSGSSLSLWFGSGSYLSIWCRSMRIRIRIHNTGSDYGSTYSTGCNASL